MQKKLPFLSFLSGKLALDNAPAFCDDKSERWLTYGELRDQTHTLTPLWHPPSPVNGRKRGLILCALPRTINGALTYLSAVNSGHALLLIDPDTSRLDLFVDIYKSDWVITPSKLNLSQHYTAQDWPMADLSLWQRAVPAKEAPHPDLFALMLPPGLPESTKSVRLSYNNISYCLQAMLKDLPFTKRTRSLIHMPLSYSFGLSILHMTLSVGGRAVFTERAIKDRNLWTMVREREVTHFAGVPFHYEYLARAGLNHLHVPQLKHFLQAGGRISVERLQEILKHVTARDGELFILYGQTEAAPRISILPLHNHSDKIGSSGQAIQGGKLSIKDSSVVYQGLNVMMGYAMDRADTTLGNTQGGTLKTGDTGMLDEEGFLFLDAK